MNKFLVQISPFIIGILFYLNSVLGYCQNTTKYYVPDSLQKYSFEELYAKQNALPPESKLLEIYINAYLHKAKNENDTIRIAHGYSQKGSFYSNEKAIHYYDSIINLTKNIDNNKYPAYGYIYKGIVQYRLGMYKKALNNFLTAQNNANIYQNQNQLILIKNYIGMIKLIFNDVKNAKKYFKEIDSLINEDSLDSYELYFIRKSTLYYLTHVYIKEKKFDTANVYAKEYKNSLLKKYDSTEVNAIYKELLAEIEFYKKNYKKSILLLNKVKEKSDADTYFNFNYLYGSSLAKLNKKDSAFAYFKKADSIYLATNDLMPETKYVQEFFINYYKDKGDLQNQLYHINRLLEIDSIYNDFNLYVNSTIVRNYETPVLLQEKQDVINALKHRNARSFRIIFSLATLSIILILIGFWYYKRQKKQKEAFKKLIKSSSTSTPNLKSKKSLKKLEGISVETLKSINTQLEIFTTNKTFLNQDITLNSLAKEFGTNATYLSKIINYTQNKNFSSYLTDLRIDHCIEKLKINKEYRKYTIQAIANECGFNNAETFSKAFYKKTGLYPSYFIKEIQNQDK